MKRWFVSVLIPLTASAVLAQQTNPQPAGAPPAPPATPVAPAAPAAPAEPAAPQSAAPATNAPAKKKAASKKKTAKKAKAPTNKTSKAEKPVKSEAKTEASWFNPPVPAVVKNDAVNVRGRPSFVGEVVGKLSKGENVQVLEDIVVAKPAKDEPSKWSRIVLPTNTPVWVSGEFVDPTTKETTSRLNVRSGPGENFSVLARVPKGTPVKEIGNKKGWLKIEAPANSFAFVASQFLEKEPASQAPAVTQPQPPSPAPVTPSPTVNMPAEQPAPVPAQPEPQPAPVTPAQPTPPVTETPATVPAPAPTTPTVEQPAVEEPLPKRIVAREGVVRRAINIQAPADFELHDAKSNELLDYLNSESPDIKLKSYIGKRVVVTGEEAMDRRWTRTPVLQLDTIEAVEVPEAPKAK